MGEVLPIRRAGDGVQSIVPCFRMDELTFDLAGFALSTLLWIGYYWFLRRRLKRDPHYTVHAVNLLARARWVETVMASDRRDVLAVQTLRNSVMTASFMASTAILMMVGVLTLSASAQVNTSIWHSLNVGAVHSELVALKLILLLLDFFAAFFSFAMAVRFFNHVGYMINVPAALGADVLSARQVTEYLNRAATCYLTGIRAFFLCVPIVFWLFGPHFMVVATVVLLAAQWRLDRAAPQS